MKDTLLVTLALTLPVFAAPSGKDVQAPAPPPQTGLWSWFMGASGGYLLDAETDMYAGHIGANTPWNIGGWNVAFYGEVGFTERDDSHLKDVTTATTTPILDVKDRPQFDEHGNLITATTLSTAYYPVETSCDIIPVSFNVKLEHALIGRLSAYAGAGLGIALVDVTSRSSLAKETFSDEDTVFYTQACAGLLYNVSNDFEICAGGRWIYMDDASIKNAQVELGRDVLLEIGARINF